MSLLAFFHGGGRRRRSTEQWTDLERQLSDAQARTEKVKGAHFHACPERIHPPYWVYQEGIPCPWCEIGRLRGQIELLTTRPAPRPGGIAVQAPADGSRITAPENEPLADPTAETQAVGVADLRNATGNSDTQMQPIVVPRRPLEPTPPVTWGRTDPETAAIEAALNIPAPPPGAGASEISMATGLTAVTKVHAVVAEAAS